MHRVVAAAALLAALASASVLFGSFTPDDLVYTNMNLWLGPDASGNASLLKPNYQAVKVLEVGWGPVADLPSVFAQIENTWVNHTAVPYITWMPYPFQTWTNAAPDRDIANGLYDAYIDAFLTRLAAFVSPASGGPRRAYLRFAPAPNGNWFPWSPSCPPCGSTGQHIQQTPADYIAMWNYVIAKVRGTAGLDKTKVQIVFDVAALDESDTLEKFYPGSSADIDWFAITGINWGTTLPGNAWLWPDKLFGPAVTRLQALSSSTPIGIVSAGSTSRGHPSGFDSGTDAKTEWINRLVDFTFAQGLKMLSYHNADSSTDVALFGGMQGRVLWMLPRPPWNSYEAYPAWRLAIRNANGTFPFVGANPTVPGLVSDAAFYGQ